MSTRRSVCLVLLSAMLAMGGLVTAVRAEDKKADATGTWKWKVTRGGTDRDIVLKLKQDGEKVTGTITLMANTETEITEGKIKDGEVTFKVVRKNQAGQERTTNYKGKVDGDTLKGKIESERNGQTSSRDWEAKRSKD
jgi:hypothetical protein